MIEFVCFDFNAVILRYVDGVWSSSLPYYESDYPPEDKYHPAIPFLTNAFPGATFYHITNAEFYKALRERNAFDNPIIGWWDFSHVLEFARNHPLDTEDV